MPDMNSPDRRTANVGYFVPIANVVSLPSEQGYEGYRGTIVDNVRLFVLALVFGILFYKILLPVSILLIIAH
jgi:hypothetical protein